MEISLKKIQEYRNRTYRMQPGARLTTPQEAIKFVNERGFIFLWPIKNVILPSLWNAVAGDRPVPDEHDDPGHVSWEWKDRLLDKRVWYYGRVLKHRNTMVSQNIIPYFYALSPNYGSPEEDMLDQYQSGELPLEAKLVFEALLKEGPLDTISLRKAAHLSGKNSDSAFNHALDILQMELKCLPVSISEAGRWHYAFVYDLTHRYYPDLLIKARPISESQARQMLVKTYLLSVGVTSEHALSSLFHWTSDHTQKALQQLINSNQVIAEVSVEKTPGTFFAQPELTK